MSSHCSGRSLPECRTHVFQLNSRYPAGEMCFPELWPYAIYPTSTYHIMFHLHRIWHCIKQSALNLNAYTSSHKTKPSCYEAMSLDAREFLVKLVPQAEKTRTRGEGITTGLCHLKEIPPLHRGDCPGDCWEWTEQNLEQEIVADMPGLPSCTKHDM